MHKTNNKYMTLPNFITRLKSGFTLIELLVVIAIISILISVGSVSYIRAMRLSRDSKRKTDLEQIRQALESYRSQNGYYPDDQASLVTDDFMSALPVDPKSPTSAYSYTPDGSPVTTYTLCASLESIETYPTCNYPVTNP